LIISPDVTLKVLPAFPQLRLIVGEIEKLVDLYDVV